MVAERWFGKVLFLQIPSKLTNVLKYFGMKPDEYPALVIAVAGIVCVCVCVCEREREGEIEKEQEKLCVCV